MTERVPPQWSRLGLYATAFSTGAMVMAIEILGSRLLAPVFGNSLFVWGALIGVILAAMSSGYAAGGWLADRHRSGAVLAGLLLASGAWTFLLAWLGQPVLFKLAAWIEDPRWGPCMAAAVLLAPPAFGLSGTLPPLLRLSVADLGYLGQHTGMMIAVSTVGSLVGTWSTAFYLLTWLGTLTLVAVLGGMQVLLGLLWWWRTLAVSVRTMTPAIGGMGLLAWLALHPVLVLPSPLYQEETPYQQLRVRDDDLFRYLILDRTFHAVMWKVDPVELYLPYSQLMLASVALVPQPTRALILGHGGGSLAKWLGRHWPELEVDLVEVDPSVVRVAERYFGYGASPRHHVHVKDARAFLRGTTGQYDLIWLDVFARHLIPFHLTTQEFFRELHAHLSPDGILAINLASSGEGPDRARARAIVTTVRTVFPSLEAYGVTGPWRTQSGAQNLIFFTGRDVAALRDPGLAGRLERLAAERRVPPEAGGLLASRLELDWPPGLVLTDDYAPYDVLIGRERGTSPEASSPVPSR